MFHMEMRSRNTLIIIIIIEEQSFDLCHAFVFIVNKMTFASILTSCNFGWDAELKKL